jgi:hypothetical protein
LIPAVVGRLRAFAAFCYDFIVGDDWRVAAGVAVALGVTYAAAQSSSSVWWIVPLAVMALLVWSLLRVTRRR